ncbi:MAG: acetylglutamate kinase, partial [Cyanobacteria bacterium]|nr:acetylglutamate kinase [Cyanobacteriota bacterium]
MSQDPVISAEDTLRVSVLSEALPYIQRFAGRRVVVKYGGAAMVREDLRDAVFRDLALLACVGVQPVVVHGGGPEINQWLKKLEIPAEFRDGLRVTDLDTMDVVEMVLVGRVNKQIVNGLNRVGGRAVGLSGSDGGLVEARTWGEGSHGWVGEVAAVNPDVLAPLLENGYIPVISSVAERQVDGGYGLVLHFLCQGVPAERWQAKQERLGRFFGPDLHAELRLIS